MGALFDDVAIFHNEDKVGVADCRKTVSDDEARFVPHEIIHGLLNENFGTRIDGARGLIQDEHRGTSEHGAITALYTVLVEGDDMNDPVGDTARSILDGHITLSRALASQGHFPTIDVLDSVSRVSGAVTTPATG